MIEDAFTLSILFDDDGDDNEEEEEDYKEEGREVDEE